MAICYQHGQTLFDTATGACLSCLAKHSAQLPLVAYRAAYAVLYPHECTVHGPSLHHVANFKCSQCFTATGQPRSRSAVNTSLARAVAQGRGDRTYKDVCATHGKVDHNTVRGQCLGCFTTLGRPRVTASGRPAANPARAAARSTGATSYLASCDVHGEVAHHTIRGKCLSCFNSLGYPRKAAV